MNNFPVKHTPIHILPISASPWGLLSKLIWFALDPSRIISSSYTRGLPHQPSTHLYSNEDAAPLISRVPRFDRCCCLLAAADSSSPCLVFGRATPRHTATRIILDCIASALGETPPVRDSGIYDPNWIKFGVRGGVYLPT